MLLATDNPLNAEIAQTVRKMFIIDVNVVHDGEECIHTRYYTALLMDIQIPVMDGCEATHLIRSLEEPERNIAMTTGASAEDRIKAFDAGMDDFLAKPRISPRSKARESAPFCGGRMTDSSSMGSICLSRP